MPTDADRAVIKQAWEKLARIRDLWLVGSAQRLLSERAALQVEVERLRRCLRLAVDGLRDASNVVGHIRDRERIAELVDDIKALLAERGGEGDDHDA